MKNKIATIFNNVMGPIGIGPSTSNTCGPCRITYLCRNLCSSPLKSARIVFPEESSFSSPSGKGMRSDYAFAHGLLGRLPDAAYPLLNAFDDLKTSGVELSFASDKSLNGPEAHLMCVIEMTDVKGCTARATAISRGGGVVEIIEIDNFNVSIFGETWTLLVWTTKEHVNEVVNSILSAWPETAEYKYNVSYNGEDALIGIPTAAEFAHLEAIREMPYVERFCSLPAILPVVLVPNPQPPFSDADELKKYCETNKKSLTDAAIDYEIAVSGWSKEAVRENARYVVSAMRNAIRSGLEPDVSFPGIVKPSANTVMQRFAESAKNGRDELTTTAAIYSLATMEYSNASGVVVCMPTAGASGTISGVLIAAEDVIGFSEEAVVDALLAAGAVGVSISEDNDFCGGVYGCQAEVGCASSMAAAAMTTLYGGTVAEAMNAASMALQNMIGLVCDPVCGLVQVPCFSRNMSAVANAIVCANMSILGFDGVIPLKDAFTAMKKSGNLMCPALKGCGGGLCDTEAAKDLLSKFHR